MRLLTDRCGLYFDLADVDGSQACLTVDTGERLALEDVDGVRLTAIVKSDERVAYDAERMESTGASAEITRVKRDEGYRWVKRFSSSAYSAEGSGIQRDDSAAGGSMEKYAIRLRADRSPSGTLSGLSIPWVDLSLRPGARIERIGSLGATRTGPSDESPAIGRISFNFRAQRTGIELLPRKHA